MRRTAILLTPSAVLALASCTSLMIGDIRVYGHALNRVTLDDVRAAIRADESPPREREHLSGIEPITEVDVVSSDEMHIYHGRREGPLWTHCVIRRMNGKWRFDGEIVILS
jgi:hypothetical protein